jgi:hypothetical protein
MSCAISSCFRTGGPSRYIDSGCVEIDESSPTAALGAVDVELIDDKPRTMWFYIGEHGKNRVMIGWKEYDARW